MSDGNGQTPEMPDTPDITPSEATETPDASASAQNSEDTPENQFPAFPGGNFPDGNFPGGNPGTGGGVSAEVWAYLGVSALTLCAGLLTAHLYRRRGRFA